jgi:hypothetical protein
MGVDPEAIMTSLSSAEILAFKRVPEGVLFAPGVALLGSSLGCRFGTTYLLNSTQLTEVGALVRRFCAAIRAVCLTYAVLCAAGVVFALGLLVAPGEWPASPEISPTVLSVTLLVAAMTPFALVFVRFALLLRRALVGAKPSVERITCADVFNAEVAALSAARLRLQIAAGVLLAIASAMHVLDGIKHGTMSSQGIWLFGLFISLYLSTHYGMLLLAKRALKASARRSR